MNMDTLFLAITVAAVLVACVMGAIVIRVFREDRRRSEARVAALAAAAAQDPDIPIVDVAYEPAVPVEHLFTTDERPSPWRTRVAVAAIVFAVATAAGYVLFSRGDAIVDGTVAAQDTKAPASTLPLELLSLRHVQENGKLVITGLVQNPRAGAALTRVSATAFAFDADGTLLARGQAPLDFSTLQPGDESPFVVPILVTGPVARYRVGFRGEDGRVIAHVDRRITGTVASRRHSQAF